MTDDYGPTIRKYFDFLINDYNYFIQIEEPDDVTYSSQKLEVGVGISLGQIGMFLRSKKQNREGHDAYALIRMHGPIQQRLQVMQFDTQEELLEHLDDELRLSAADLRKFGHDVLSGSVEAWECFEKYSRDEKVRSFGIRGLSEKDKKSMGYDLVHQCPWQKLHPTCR